MSDGLALHVLRALPWFIIPALILWRLSRSRTLDDEPLAPPAAPPRVTIIVPARNEARNIGACVQSMLSTQYPALELIVVDDHSTDGTGDLARRAMAGDPRARVLEPPPLPDDWFGKQWACWTGVQHATGEILLFADADTRHAPDLVPRAVNALRARDADLLSVAGHQELGSFWEWLVQPLFFGMLATRYGNTEWVSHSPFAFDKIANGQCFLMTREAYDAVGGHAAVRHNVAEDLLMGQHVFRSGRTVAMVAGMSQLSTRMYHSLGEIIRGWGKNIYAGGRYASPGGRVGQFLYPLLLVPSTLALLIPLGMVALALARIVDRSWLVDGLVAWGWLSALGMVIQHRIGGRAWVAPLYPLGALVMAYVAVYAVIRGRRVEWKGRTYVSS